MPLQGRVRQDRRPLGGFISHSVPPSAVDEQADLITIATVDEKGRVSIDGQIREMADIRGGDKLRVSLVRGTKNWLISITPVGATPK